jgi:Domain of unknown function (DUF4157)
MSVYESEQLTAAPRSGSVRGRGAADKPGAAEALLRLQRVAGNESVNTLLEQEERSPVRNVVEAGGGSPLEPGLRGLMEDRFGQDFSGVRIHTGAVADASARSINAQAYTVGSDVVFRNGAYQPGTPVGQRIVAHELTHVLQQRSGPVAGEPVAGGIRLSDPSDPFEQAAERTADSVMAQRSPGPVGGEASSVQRAQTDDEEDVQTLVAQRAEDEEEDEESA